MTCTIGADDLVPDRVGAKHPPAPQSEASGEGSPQTELTHESQFDLMRRAIEWQSRFFAYISRLLSAMEPSHKCPGFTHLGLSQAWHTQRPSIFTPGFAR